jgi:hypothetical protein
MLDGTLGALVGIFASWLFYRFGKRDAVMVYRDGVITSVVMRLKEMTPTSKARVQNGFGLDDTAHWIICLAEVMDETGWSEGAKGLKQLAGELGVEPHFANPTEEQKKEGERKKVEWIRTVYKIHEPKNRKG